MGKSFDSLNWSFYNSEHYADIRKEFSSFSQWFDSLSNTEMMEYLISHEED